MFKKRWFDTTDHRVESEMPRISSTLKFLFTVGSLTFFGSCILILTMKLSAPKTSNPSALFSLGNVIQFWPSTLFLYVTYFGMGIIAYKKKWIERDKFAGHHIAFWLIPFLVLLIAYSFLGDTVLNAPTQFQRVYWLVSFFIRNLLTMSILGLFTSFAFRYWNRPTAVDQNLASNSYYMFLAHYIFVIVFQLILFTFHGIPGLLKFGIVSALSILCSYVVSQFLIKPFPRASIAVAASLFITMAIFIRP